MREDGHIELRLLKQNKPKYMNSEKNATFGLQVKGRLKNAAGSSVEMTEGSLERSPGKRRKKKTLKKDNSEAKKSG